MKKCSSAIIGISGFGRTHLNISEKLEKDGVMNLAAICEINFESNRGIIDELEKRGVKYYRNYVEMLESEKNLDFVSISTPLHLHKKMAVDVMKSGSHVLLEKPPAVTIQDMDEIIGTSLAAERHCAVDFMMTSGKAFLALKRYIMDGRLGKITSITGKGLWKRLDDYYSRTPWAGKLAVNGSYVLDGSVTNPLSHILNNMMLLAGVSGGNSISAVTAELYHAHSIEGEDTSCIKAEMDNGTDLFFFTTLCNAVQLDPSIIIEGTLGKAVWNIGGDLELICGTQKETYRFVEVSLVENMYRNLCAVIVGEEKELYCSAADTRNFVLASNGAFESSAVVHDIPSRYIRRYEDEGSTATDISDIDNIIQKAVEGKKLFSEIGVEWAVGGKRVQMRNYKEFGMFKGVL